MRIGNLDDIYQKQLIWSYDRIGVDDAYFYQDWCPTDDGGWELNDWEEFQTNNDRKKVRTFKYSEIVGYSNGDDGEDDEMPKEYDASTDQHAKDGELNDEDYPTNLDSDILRHNIMRSYIEVSEWLGDGATQYGSHNGYVSRKMSMAWLFGSIRGLINWKLNN